MFYLQMEQINLDLPFQSDEITNIKTDASRLLPQESVPMDHEQKTIDASTRQSEIEHVCYLKVISHLYPCSTPVLICYCFMAGGRNTAIGKR